MTAVATSQGADQLADLTALADGYSAAFLGAAGIAVAGALLAAVLLRVPKARDRRGPRRTPSPASRSRPDPRPSNHHGSAGGDAHPADPPPQGAG
jgi:hypothetical protein